MGSVIAVVWEHGPPVMGSRSPTSAPIWQPSRRVAKELFQLALLKGYNGEKVPYEGMPLREREFGMLLACKTMARGRPLPRLAWTAEL